MENRRNSHQRKTDNQSIIYVSSHFSSIETFAFPSFVRETTIEADISFFESDSRLSISDDCDLKATIPLTKKNVISMLSLAHIRKELNNQIYKTNRQLRISKKIKTAANKTNKIVYSKDKLIPLASSSWDRQKKELFKYLNNFPSLNVLPEIFLQIPYFKNYQNCHFLIHERGSNKAMVFSYNYFSNLRSGTFPISEFSSLFSLVKKSKHKSFHSHGLKNLKIKTLRKRIDPFSGTFLAEDISLTNHNIIIIASRNDFLPPLKEELLFFNRFVKLLPFHLEILLAKESIGKKNKYQLECLRELPKPIAIYDDKNSHIFKNHSFLASSTISHYKPLINKIINLKNNAKLIFYQQGQEDVATSELFHFQRITLLGELLNTLKHELSNPLFGLKLATDLLQGEFNLNLRDEELLVFLKDISNNVERCQNIINDFSKIYSHKQTSSKLSLRKSISEALILAKSEIRDIAKNVTYTNYEDNDPVWIIANHTWVIQILFNLFINSSQAIKGSTTPGGRPAISIDIRSNTMKHQKNVSISVSDNGPGIKPEDQQLLFSPFYTTKKSGTGLGLVICKNLANKMGGEIMCTAPKNNDPGATFTLTLPYAEMVEEKA